jgi:hypothetical protein
MGFVFCLARFFVGVLVGRVSFVPLVCWIVCLVGGLRVGKDVGRVYVGLIQSANKISEK